MTREGKGVGGGGEAEAGGPGRKALEAPLSGTTGRGLFGFLDVGGGEWGRVGGLQTMPADSYRRRATGGSLVAKSGRAGEGRAAGLEGPPAELEERDRQASEGKAGGRGGWLRRKPAARSSWPAVLPGEKHATSWGLRRRAGAGAPAFWS